MALVPCLACQRHVRVGDGACPFCGRPLDATAASRVVPGANRLLDRVAFFTFATTFAVAACSTGGGGGIVEDGGSGDGGVTSDGSVRDDGGVQALYGMPADSGFDAGMQAAYGVPPEDSGGAQPPYGMPPEDAGGS